MEEKFAKVIHEGSCCIFDRKGFLEEMESFFDNDEEGDSVEIHLVEMTREEFDALDEFTGW